MPKSVSPRVLVVGSGFGCRIQVPALRAAGFEVVGLVGTDGPRTLQRAADNGVPQAFIDLDDAISKTGATAVTVATPPHTHAPLVLNAIARGCHVVCEKPFAKNAGEARAMLDAAQKAGIVHLLGNEFRLEPQRAVIGRMIAQGLIGEPRFLTFTQFLHYVGAPDVDLPHWWLDASQGGGWLGTWGSHVVDWVRTWLGEFSSLNAVLPRISTAQGEAEDSYIVRFRLENGAEGTLHQSGGAWGPLAAMVRVAGTKGTIWLDNGVIWLADRDGTRAVPVEPEFLLPPALAQSTDPRQARAEWQMMSYVELAPYLVLGQIWRALINGEKPPSAVPLATFVDGVAAMEVLDAIRVSAAKDGALVRIRPS
jgi:predicted dehydrogenase